MACRRFSTCLSVHQGSSALAALPGGKAASIFRQLAGWRALGLSVREVPAHQGRLSVAAPSSRGWDGAGALQHLAALAVCDYQRLSLGQGCGRRQVVEDDYVGAGDRGEPGTVHRAIPTACRHSPRRQPPLFSQRRLRWLFACMASPAGRSGRCAIQNQRSLRLRPRVMAGRISPRSRPAPAMPAP